MSVLATILYSECEITGPDELMLLEHSPLWHKIAYTAQQSQKWSIYQT